MRLKKIKSLSYTYGEEEQLKQILYKSKEPLLIKIKGFTDKFSLDYFEENIQGTTGYCIFDEYRYVSSQTGDFATVISEIKKNQPFRIFGQFSTKVSSELEQHVPLWQAIPLRPRFFNKQLKIAYFFGGRGSVTDLHFDREHCCNLHLCLSGKKQIVLFTEDQSDNLYKVPYIGDALIDFSQSLEVLRQQYPRLNQALGYNVYLEQGDMLFLPRNCWHYTRYLEASSSATYVFYPKKLLQIYGFFTGFFFLGYKRPNYFNIADWPIFKAFSWGYAWAEGWKKKVLKVIEALSYVFLLPVVSIATYILYKRKSRR